MLRTLLIVFMLTLIPAVAAAEETAPAAACSATYDLFLPGTFGAEAVRAGVARERVERTSSFGRHADFNGDGCADLVVGAPGLTSYVVTRSKVEVFYGSADGLLSPAPQTLIVNNDQGTRFGYALAAGDFDDDGYSDLAVGEPNAEVDGELRAGVVHVFYGSPDGLEDVPRSVFHQDTPGVPGAVERNDFFGFALAAGNLNSDPYDDLAIGVPYEDIGDVTDAGYLIVLFGSRDGLVAQDAQGFHQDTPNVPGVPEEEDRFGWALTTYGSPNAPRLAVSAPWEDVEILGEAHGAVLIFETSRSGLDPNGRYTQQTVGVEGSPEPGDAFGYALTSGDFDGDGYFDLVVGSPYEDLFGEENTGRIDIFYAGLETDAWYQNKSGIPGAEEPDDNFGFALAAGKFDDDDYWDLAIGVPGEDISGNTVKDAGAVVVMYGTDDGVKADRAQAILLRDQVANADLGRALTAADYNGDGFADLAAGAPSHSTTGLVLLRPGQPSGLGSDRFLTQAGGGFEVPFFGFALE